MCWELEEFNKVVSDFIAKNPDLGDAIEEVLDLLSEYGNRLQRPHSAPLGDGLFELRKRVGRKRVRLIFFFDEPRRAIFVVACVKTTSAVDPRDIALAKQRRLLIQRSGEGSYGITIENQIKPGD